MRDPRGTRADVIDASEFQLDLQLQPKELPGYLFVMTLFYVVFTITFYVGIRIETVYEVMGTSSKSEALMDTYNTYSGYVMALVEVLLSMYAGKFVPVLEVYVHNKFFFLVRDSEGKRRSIGSRRVHTALLLLLPVVLSLTNSSIKSLQAVQVTTGVKRVMTVDDMKKEMSVIEQIKVKSKKDAAQSTNAKDTILINAIRQNATPFTFETDSPCGLDTEDGGGASDWVLNAHEMGSTSAIYGFIPREWNSEALIEPTLTSTYTVSYAQAADAFQGNVSLPGPGKLSLKTAYEMLVQGKMVIESAFGNSVIGWYECSHSDGLGANGVSPSSVSGPNTTAVPSPDIDVFVDDSQNQWTVVNNSRMCEGGVSSMFHMSNFYSRDVFRAEDLIRDAVDTVSVTIPDIARDETSITLAKYNLTPQVHLEVMQIELIMNKTVPTVKEVRSTAVVYGFPTRYWNVDAVPFGLKPSHSFACPLNNGTISSEESTAFQSFLDVTNVTWLTMYESFLQGKLLFERSVSDANASAVYPCFWSDDKHELDLRSNDSTIIPNGNIFSEGPYKGKRRCFGAVSSLGALGNISDPTKHNVDSFLTSVKGAFLKTADQIEPKSMKLTLDEYKINSQLKLTSMTLDMQYYKECQYRDTSMSCNGSSLLPYILDAFTADTDNAEDIESIRTIMCDQENYLYLEPSSTCGHNNCIFLDQSGTISFKKQLQLMPYMTNCSTDDLKYNPAFRNFFPSGCKPVNNAVFLYGLGSYMSGDLFDISLPYISKPRRHVVLTFAKLEWTFQDINTTFGAECGVDESNQPSQCKGLLYELENVTVPAEPVTNSDVFTRVLVLGESQLPVGLADANYRSPVQLLSLNARRFYYPKFKKFYEWEYLDFKHFNSTNSTQSIDIDQMPCSSLVDSYISTLETNNYYMDDPRQPLYTAALFYLFQDAAVKTVKRNERMDERTWRFTSTEEASIMGTTTLKGDLAEHQVMFKIPFLSLVLTFAGLLLLRLLALVATVTPVPRLRMTEDANESVAHQYARLRQEDEYPRQVFDRGLKLRTGKRVALDNYVVESLTLHHKANLDKKARL